MKTIRPLQIGEPRRELGPVRILLGRNTISPDHVYTQRVNDPESRLKRLHWGDKTPFLEAKYRRRFGAYAIKVRRLMDDQCIESVARIVMDNFNPVNQTPERTTDTFNSELPHFWLTDDAGGVQYPLDAIGNPRKVNEFGSRSFQITSIESAVLFSIVVLRELRHRAFLTVAHCGPRIENETMDDRELRIAIINKNLLHVFALDGCRRMGGALDILGDETAGIVLRGIDASRSLSKATEIQHPLSRELANLRNGDISLDQLMPRLGSAINERDTEELQGEIGAMEKIFTQIRNPLSIYF
ncbi:MAG: hypothetical protein ABII22_00275 [Candidatus Micrarchaeota archaeon]